MFHKKKTQEVGKITDYITVKTLVPDQNPSLVL